MGLKLENVASMASDQISTSTISNIERGFLGVKETKLKLYCKLLEVDYDRLPILILEDENLHIKLTKNLKQIEQRIDLINGVDKPQKLLRKIIKDVVNKPIEVVHCFLTARCYYHKKEFDKSYNYFTNTLQLLDYYPEMEITNIRAASLKELGRISFFHFENLVQALEYTEQGLSSFQPNGERIVTKYTLLSSKASYLEKMQRDEEALKVLNELWSEQDQWFRNIDVVLNMFEIRANICAKHHLYDEAMKFAEEGIVLARSNKQSERALELLTTLGHICVLREQLEEAEDWYELALDLKSQIKKEYLFVSTYTQLGHLYMSLQNWEKAKLSLEEAVKIGASNHDSLRYHLALIAFGDFYVKQEEPSLATNYYEKALEQAEKHGFPLVDNELYAKLSHCLKEKDSARSEKFMEKYIKSILK